MVAEVSGPGEQAHPEISRDGLTLYFQDATGATNDIHVTTRPDRDAAFGAPVRVDELSGDEDDDSVTTDASARVLVLASLRGGRTTRTLFEARRGSTAAPWGVPVPILELTVDAETHAPHLDDPGLVVYFQRFVGGRDLFWAERASLTSPWGPATPLSELNTTGDEYDPWVSPDHRTIYFVRDLGGDKDIYMATRP